MSGRNGSKGNHGSELRVIFQPVCLIGIGPLPIKNIFAVAVIFNEAIKDSVFRFINEIERQPTRFSTYGMALFQGIQEVILQKRGLIGCGLVPDSSGNI